MTTTTPDGILDAALTLFARDGVAATSLQAIADAVGISKATVLYHFASKDAMIERSMGTAVAEIERVYGDILRVASGGVDAAERAEVVHDFIDFMLVHQREASIFINQGFQLRHLPVMQGVLRMFTTGDGACSGPRDPATMSYDESRVGVVFAGIAYVTAFPLVAGVPFDAEAMRATLEAVMTDALPSSDTASGGAGRNGARRDGAVSSEPRPSRPHRSRAHPA